MDRPIFILGTHRSGTTLLRLILDSHPSIAIPEETGFMRAVEATQAIPGWRYGPGWYERLGIDDEAFIARLRGFYSELFEQYAEHQGKRRWGEKTPFHVWHLETISALFPDADFVGIVRHPGAVVNSLINRWNHNLEEAITQWRDMNLAMLAHGMRPGTSFALCRYEDLVHHSEDTLRALVAFLDEPWDDALLQHHAAQRDKGAPRTVDGGARPRDPIDASRADGWVSRLTPEHLAAIEAGAGGLAAFFGYAMNSAEPPGHLCGVDRPGPGQLVWGSELEHLRSQHPRAPASFDVPVHAPTQKLRELTREELEERLLRSETALERMQARRAVQVGNAIRRLRRANSLAELGQAVTGVRLRKYR